MKANAVALWMTVSSALIVCAIVIIAIVMIADGRGAAFWILGAVLLIPVAGALAVG